MGLAEELEYHKGRMDIWQTSVESYEQKVEELEYFADSDDPLSETELPVLIDQVAEYTGKILPDAQDTAKDSYMQVLDARKKAGNSVNHGFSYDDLPHDPADQEALYKEADEIAGQYLSIEKDQDAVIEQLTQLAGPIHHTGSVEVLVSPDDTYGSSLRQNLQETAASYTEAAKNKLNDSSTESLVALGSVLSAAVIGEYLSQRTDTGQESENERLASV